VNKTKVYDYMMILGIIIVVVALLWWVMSYSNPDKVKAALSAPLDIELPTYKTVSSAFETSGDALGDGAIISRPIQGLGGFRHYGVMIGGMVAHYNQYGYHLDSISDFAAGDIVKVVKRGLTGDNLKIFKKRYRAIIKKYDKSDYDAMKNNCEHFANEMVFGKHISMQSDLTQDMMKSYNPMIREEISKSKLSYLLPAYDNYVKKIMKDTIKN